MVTVLDTSGMDFSDIKKEFGINYTTLYEPFIIPSEKLTTRTGVAGEVESILLCSIFCIGLPLSSFAFYKTYKLYSTEKRDHKIKHPMLILRLNLNVADLMTILIYIPRQAVWMRTYQWYGGTTLCKLAAFFSTFCFYLNAFVICCIALERAICAQKLMDLHQQQDKNKMLLRTKIMLLACYGCSAVFSIPQLFIFHVVAPFPNFQQCASVWAVAYQESVHTYLRPEMPFWMRAEHYKLLKTVEAAYSIFHLIAVYWFPVTMIFTSYFSVLVLINRQMKARKQEEEEWERRANGIIPAILPTVRRSCEMAILSFVTSLGSGLMHLIARIKILCARLLRNFIQLLVSCWRGCRNNTNIACCSAAEEGRARESIEMAFASQAEEAARMIPAAPDSQIQPANPNANVNDNVAVVRRAITNPAVKVSNTLRRARQYALRQATLIIIAYLTFWSPYQVMSIVSMYFRKSDEAEPEWLNILNAIICANTLANPFIYGVFSTPLTRR